jgi:hypothetical protein
MRLVANGGRQVDNRVDPTERLALKVTVAQAGKVTKGDLHVDSVTSQPAGIPHECPDVLPLGQEEWQERPSDGSARTGQQDHGA